MHKKLHQNIASVIASLIVIEGALLMSSCTTTSTSAETDEGQAIDEIIIQPDIQETTSEDAIESGEPAVANVVSGAWYEAEKAEIGPAFTYLTTEDDNCELTYYYAIRDFATIYTGTDSNNRMYICESVADDGSIQINVKDTTDGDDIGTIDTSSVIYDNSWRDYYTFVFNDTPYLEVDILDSMEEIESVEFYEINPETMMLGEQVDLFPEQDIAVKKAIPLPDGICLLTKEGHNHSEEFIHIYDNSGYENNSISLVEIFGVDTEYDVVTLIPYGVEGIYISAIMLDEEYAICSAMLGYGDAFDANTEYPEADLYYAKYYVSPYGEVYTISNAGILRLNDVGEFEMYIDFNNIYGDSAGIRGSNIVSINEDGSVSLLGYDYSEDFDSYCYDIELDITDNTYVDRIPVDIGVTESNLTLSYYSDLISAFNVSNDTYYARLVVLGGTPDYSSLDEVATADDSVYLRTYYNLAYEEDNQIVQELLDSSAPDVYLSSGIENYLIQSGAFKNVCDFINDYLSDNSGMYFDNIITAPANHEGELYQVPLRFYISGVFANDGNDGDIVFEDSSFSSFEDRIENDWNGGNPIRGWIGEDYPIELIETHLHYYFNGESFDDEALTELFNYVLAAPNDNYDNYSDIIYQSAFSVLDLYYYTLIDFQDLDNYVTVPGPEGTSFGAVAGALNTISISANTDQLEGAEAFMEFALGYEAQKLDIDSYGMPIHRTAFEEFNDDVAAVYGADYPEDVPEGAEEFLLRLIESVDNDSFYIIDTKLDVILSDILSNISEDDSDGSDMAAELNARYQE